MTKQYIFTTEDSKSAVVRFSITENKGENRPFGISAEIDTGDGETEKYTAECRFFTYEEAEKTMEMLCENGVTPCTLCDII